MSALQRIRGVFSFMRGNILVLTLTQVLGRFFRSMVMPYASLYILALGGEPAQIGLINSLRPLAGLIMFPISGYLTDRTGRVRLIALAGYLSGATMLLYVLAPSWEWIALAAFLQGFMTLQFPPTSAIIADSLEPSSRGTGIATMNTVASGDRHRDLWRCLRHEDPLLSAGGGDHHQRHHQPPIPQGDLI
jgi:MFS family permease